MHVRLLGMYASTMWLDSLVGDIILVKAEARNLAVPITSRFLVDC